MQNRRVLYTRAPLRLGFAGGGTDAEPFASQYGGCVVSASIAKYVWVKVMLGEARSCTCYPYGETSTEFIETIGKHFPPASIELRVDVPPQSGLGASGAIGVATVMALRDVFEKHNPKHTLQQIKNDIIAFAHKIETEEMSIPGGKQDQCAAAWGGINYMEFGADRFEVTHLQLSQDVLLTLENSLIITYIHPRLESGGSIMRREVDRVRAGDLATIDALKKQKELANEARRMLRHGFLADFGALLDEAWQYKKRQSPEATTGFIDDVYSVAKKAGALGGKISGAGGGGYLFFLALGKEGPVADALLGMGLHPETVTFDTKGVTAWKP